MASAASGAKAARLYASSPLFLPAPAVKIVGPVEGIPASQVLHCRYRVRHGVTAALRQASNTTTTGAPLLAGRTLRIRGPDSGH
eukprot:scaffold169_cov222-Prasinococcus_capsulatus_cf.AAC.1